ncbi:hypothetical protein CONLIGDRAFT_682011 [Coniochaeta ligniaria NRRL 30616]|uniref:AA1-like domain-containing protein n=1 Tax=Coniochaeta ligniaria NRRL 30616 TaxID=1408157 RepID=A0A1J7INP4_9PEZI|nr:hypothetical protein CONLIGDRAFT_682011 [Coniochaeta ligniaria NRRL 30616]
MVLLAACILGSLVGLRVAASPMAWQGQYDHLQERSASRETSGEQPFPNRPTTRTTDNQSCTIDSFTNTTSFILREYQIETVVGAGNSTQFRGTFSVENPGSGDTYRLYHIPISVGGGVWSVCRAGDDAPLPPQLVLCQYLLERRNGRIGFRFEWDCDGRDSNQPVLFDATVIGELPAEVCVARNGTEGVTQSCGLPVDVGEVLLPIQNISFEPTSGQRD